MGVVVVGCFLEGILALLAGLVRFLVWVVGDPWEIVGVVVLGLVLGLGVGRVVILLVLLELLVVDGLL